ncbi:hypothetical protein V3390_09240 [Luteimonas sp. FXH3W]|uniref:Uncharacterized protein n=1 Tax=Aquilutibacter rugosus TaxID=3115820 RepID=A0ABU7V0V3_9GAMM
MITPVLQAVWMGLKGAAETVATAVAWAFKPANRFKALALVLCIKSSALLIRLIDARSTIVVVQAKAASEAQSANFKLGQLTLERDEYKRSFMTLKADIEAANKANAEAYAQAQKDNADAMTRLRADQLKADKSQTKQLQVIQNQDAVCKAALESLDVYCKGVGEL